MILSGEKTEEYREIKPYWINRLCKTESFSVNNTEISTKLLKEYDAVKLTNGYGATLPNFTIKLIGITVGQGNPEWGAPEEPVFILKLGKILEKNL